MGKYEKIKVPEWMNDIEKKINQLEAAKEEIKNYDYIGIKIATGVATIQEYTNEIEYMQSIRQVIRELEQELKTIQEENEESIDE